MTSKDKNIKEALFSCERIQGRVWSLQYALCPRGNYGPSLLVLKGVVRHIFLIMITWTQIAKNKQNKYLNLKYKLHTNKNI